MVHSSAWVVARHPKISPPPRLSVKSPLRSLDVVEVLAVRLLQRGCSEGREGDGGDADGLRASRDAEAGLESLKGERQKRDGAADEVRDRGRRGGADVRAELLGRDGHEHGPVAASRSEEQADPVEALER